MTRILVVEDDPSIRMGLEDTLTAKGYQVEVVGRGGEGAEKALSGRYDLVVLDVMLPDIDGFEVLRRVRQSRGPIRRLPVIMLSARGAELDRVRGLELGADDYVTKPFSLMELLARVASVLRRAQGETAEPVGLGQPARCVILVRLTSVACPRACRCLAAGSRPEAARARSRSRANSACPSERPRSRR